MPSRFAWIDTDEASRRAMLDFVDQFRDQGTLDELGIGTIRDAFADYFFPGTTTVQTRARYFLFVPWIYRKLESRKTSSADVARKLREAEIALLDAMLEGGVGEGERLIGRQSRAALKRWPSSIYWAGLKTWGIRKLDASQEAYHRSLDSFYRLRRFAEQEPESDLAEQLRSNWDQDPQFPDPPDRFPAGSTMQLRKEEAEYLAYQIKLNCRNSLLANLVGNKSALGADVIWTLPKFGDLPTNLQDQILNAKWFAYAIHGANLLYHWSVGTKGGQSKPANEAKAALDKWDAELTGEWAAFNAWADARQKFWGSPAFHEARIPDRTRRFVSNWIDDLINQGSPHEIWTRKTALQLIEDRERETKTEARARLWNKQHRERWDPKGIPTLLDFRWGITQWILEDIQAGLEIEESAEQAA